MLLWMINSQNQTVEPPVSVQAPKMNDTVLTELKELLIILGKCLTSFHNDFNTLDCNSSHAVMTSIVFKLEKMVECAKSIKRICKSLKKENIPCLPCLTSTVDNQPSKDQEPLPKSK